MAPPTNADIDLSIDYYELLSISAAATESEIRRAYRKTSILYHPDKVAPTPENLEKFHQLQIALNLLTSPEEKAKYDQTREAKQRRKAENEALESRRRKLKEDLERREADFTNGNAPGSVNGTKRTWSDRELAINRIREENRKRMEAVNVQRAQERKEQEEKQKPQEAPTDSIERSVKVRWVRQGDGLDIDQQALEDEFAAGEVEHVLVLKDKKRRLDGKKEKVVMGTAVVVFSTLAAAKNAIKRGPWDGIESVVWAADKESEPS